MIEFSYARAEDTSGAIRLSSAAARPKYLGGGTNLVDLMRETVERPDALVDVTGLSSDIEARGDGSLLIGAAAKNTAVAADRRVRTHFPIAVARAPVGREWTDSQHGDCRRQHPAAHPMHIFLRRCQPLQQACARCRMRCDRRFQSISRDPRRVAVLCRDPSVRHVRCARGPRCARSSRRTQWQADAKVR